MLAILGQNGKKENKQNSSFGITSFGLPVKIAFIQMYESFFQLCISKFLFFSSPVHGGEGEGHRGGGATDQRRPDNQQHH